MKCWAPEFASTRLCSRTQGAILFPTALAQVCEAGCPIVLAANRRHPAPLHPGLSQNRQQAPGSEGRRTAGRRAEVHRLHAATSPSPADAPPSHAATQPPHAATQPSHAATQPPHAATQPPHTLRGMPLARRSNLPSFDDAERERPPAMEFLERHNSKLAQDLSIVRHLEGGSRQQAWGGPGSRGGALRGDDGSGEEEQDPSVSLVQAIKGCGSVAELSELLAAHWGRLGMVPTTASLVRLVKLTSHGGWDGGAGRKGFRGNKGGAEAEALLRLLLPGVMQVAWEMDAQGVCNVVWALSKVRWPEGESGGDNGVLTLRALLGELMRVATMRAPDMNAQNMSNLLYALATQDQREEKNRRRPAAAAAMPGPARRLPPTRGGAPAAATAAAAAGRLVSAAALQPLLDACGSKLYMFGPQALSNTAWALARLGARPTPAWQSAFLARSVLLLSKLLPAEMSTMMWALLKLGVLPDAYWTERMLQASLTSFHRYSFRDLANLAWAAANMGLKPPAAWVQALCLAAAAPVVASGADAAGVAGLMYALSSWRAKHLPEPFLASLWERSASPAALDRFSGEQLCDLVRSLSRLSVTLPGPWSTALMIRLEATLGAALEVGGEEEQQQQFAADGSGQTALKGNKQQQQQLAADGTTGRIVSKVEQQQQQLAAGVTTGRIASRASKLQPKMKAQLLAALKSLGVVKVAPPVEGSVGGLPLASKSALPLN